MLAATPLPLRRARSGSPSPPGPARRSGSSCSPTLVYTLARFVTIGDLASAKDNAHWIVDLQNSLGIGVEASVQGAFDGTWMLWVLNHLYLIAQLGVIPAALIFLYRRSFAIYATLRNTILATWLISVPVYGLFPVAPPRLADIGITDTITAQTGFDMNSNFTTSFYNELAAVPSLHVGFAVAVGFALVRRAPQPGAAATSRCCGARSSASPWSPPATTSSSTSIAGVAASVAGLRPRHHGRRGSASSGRRRRRSARPSPRPESPQITSASTVPTTVSTVLVPTKNAATCAAGTAVPVTGSKVAARIAAPAPTEAGENGTSRPLLCANTTSSTAAGVAGRPKAARKHAERAEAQQRGSRAATAARRARRRAGSAAPRSRGRHGEEARARARSGGRAARRRSSASTPART